MNRAIFGLGVGVIFLGVVTVPILLLLGVRQPNKVVFDFRRGNVMTIGIAIGIVFLGILTAIAGILLP